MLFEHSNLHYDLLMQSHVDYDLICDCNCDEDND